MRQVLKATIFGRTLIIGWCEKWENEYCLYEVKEIAEGCKGKEWLGEFESFQEAVEAMIRQLY